MKCAVKEMLNNEVAATLQEAALKYTELTSLMRVKIRWMNFDSDYFS